MLGSGWHRLPCGAAVLVDDDGQAARVCDLGVVTLDIDEGLFAGDEDFLEVLTDDLRAVGFEVVLDDWAAASEALRTTVALALGDEEIAERAASVADVLRAERSGSSTSAAWASEDDEDELAAEGVGRWA